MSQEIHKDMGSRKNVFYLPDDMTTQILLKLPVKSLLRFKCVCKNWYAHIVDQSFMDNHFHSNSNKERLLLCSYKPGTKKHAFALFSDETFSESEEPFCLQQKCAVIDLLGPFNGMFCIVRRNGTSMIMVNPATREVKPISSLQITVPSYFFIYYTTLGLGSDPLSSYHFKLVMIRCFWDNQRSRLCYPSLIGLYTSRTDSWRYFEDPDLVNSMLLVKQSLCDTCVDGVYYWRTIDKSDVTAGILAFDMKSECFRKTPVPDSGKLKVGALGLCLDSIALFSYEYGSPPISIDVWLRNRDDGSWVKHFNVGPLDGFNVIHPLGVWKKDGVVFKDGNGRMVLYNLVTKDFKILPGEACHRFIGYSVFSYKESLIPLQVGNGP